MLALFVGCANASQPAASVQGATTTAIPAGVASRIALQQSGGISGTAVLWTASTWPANVSVNAIAAMSGEPAPLSARRKGQSASVLAAWKIVFSSTTATGTLTSPPFFQFSGVTTPSSVVVELFDVTAGGSPQLFGYDAATGTFISTGSTYQIALGDTFYLEVVANPLVLQTPQPTPTPVATAPVILGAAPDVQVFSYTGSQQNFTVPAGVSQVTIYAIGAQGGAAWGSNNLAGGSGGYGGQTTATIPVTAGQTLAVFVGGAASSVTGGFNGAGNGGIGIPSYVLGGGGGGASDVRVGGNALSNRVVVAGGGGGGGAGGGAGNGGNGGGPVAANGGASSDGFANGGGGGTQFAGGLPATVLGFPSGAPGSLGAGGIGGAVPATSADYEFVGVGGGGGGGYYGGGGGARGAARFTDGTCTCGSGGGGGSSFAEAGATNVLMTQGTNNGNGWVTITW